MSKVEVCFGALAVGPGPACVQSTASKVRKFYEEGLGPFRV